MTFADEIKNISKNFKDKQKQAILDAEQVERLRKEGIIENYKTNIFSTTKIRNLIKEEASNGRDYIDFEIFSEENPTRAFWESDVIAWIMHVIDEEGFDTDNTSVRYQSVKYSDDSPTEQACFLRLTW